MAECSHDCSTCSQKCSKESMIEPQNKLSKVKRVIGIVSGKGGACNQRTDKFTGFHFGSSSICFQFFAFRFTQSDRDSFFLHDSFIPFIKTLSIKCRPEAITFVDGFDMQSYDLMPVAGIAFV